MLVTDELAVRLIEVKLVHVNAPVVFCQVVIFPEPPPYNIFSPLFHIKTGFPY